MKAGALIPPSKTVELPPLNGKFPPCKAGPPPLKPQLYFLL